MAKDILSSAPETDYVEKASKIDPKEFQKVINSRRSVRIFDGKPIPGKIMDRCLENAILAPNSSNLQQWEFHLVQSAGKKNALINACLDQVAAKTASELVVAVARTSTWKAHAEEMLRIFGKAKGVPRSAVSYYKKLVPFVYSQGPLGIFGFVKSLLYFFKGLSSPIIREPVNKAHMKIWAVKSTALGCENLMLSLRAYGYDSCPMEGYDSKRIKKILGLPRDAVVVMVIAAGKRAKGGIYGERIRFAKNEFIKKD
ncbi:MAG TPA: nitroreductase family protein [Spirochaetota bacterium]|nr:nitroreductase family protein [Spirochaetota bacterium]